MSLKRFNADLQSAHNRLADPGIPGLVAIKHGKAEGEIIVTFIHKKLTNAIPIRFFAADPTSYPDGNNFLLSTDAQGIHPTVTSALEDLQNFTFGQTVFESLRDVSSGLIRALSQHAIDANGDAVMGGRAHDDPASADEYDEYDEYDFEEDDDYDEDEDVIFSLGSGSDQKSKAPRTEAKMGPSALRKIRRDLRKARDAGAKIGILGGVENEALTHTVSLSIRARKLGISDEALEAWDVDPSDYIVLLYRIEEPYPSAETLLQHASSSFDADFRFGKCQRSKPSPDSVRRAFDAQSHNTDVDQHAKTQATDTMADSHSFEKLFISNSMEQFMKEHFFALAKLRMGGHQSWDDANSHILNLVFQQKSESTARVGEAIAAKYMGQSNGNGKGKEVAYTSAQSSFADAIELRRLPAILTWDSFSESTEDISMPLVAMQFALHYFVRCTEYCLRCHRKVKKDFEALKPFVCEDSLCLFQYITMGFGPSIEHEILSQPYVVDLLVTLCYSSIQHVDPHGNRHTATSGNSQSTYPIRDFPSGLRLKVASLPPSLTPLPFGQTLGAPTHANAGGQDEANVYGTPIRVFVDFNSNTMSAQDPEDAHQLTEKSWVVLRHQLTPTGSLPPPVLVHQAYLKYVDRLANRAEFEMKYQDLSSSEAVQACAGPKPMDLYKYDVELDDLNNAGKAKAMTVILDTTPPISHLREYLVNHPHSRLKSYQGISPSAATLLEWIVASNRSYILQVNRVEDVHAKDRDLLETIKTRDQEIIPSLGQGYVQFRFAMGNPDKELRFQRALKELEGQAKMQYPTLFAWHGSATQNWHSILRQGLDFKKITNGRAHGNGVYFSPQYITSQYYMHVPFTSWSNSALSPTGVIALCEIINAPARFMSSSPHYVVQELDWIQCRYLFIQTAAAASLRTSPSAISLSPMDELPQDPARKVRGPKGESLRIPRKAVPASRGGKGGPKNPGTTPSKRSHDSDTARGDTDEEDSADLDALFSDDEASPPPRKRLQALVTRLQDASRDSSVDTVAVHQVTTQRPPTPPKLSVVPPMTDFRPGTLNLKSIPKLALPQWANSESSKRLANDIKIMQRVQKTTPLHELGWYIDFSNIENMFQWIVELHTFDPDLPLAKDMKKGGITSIVLEVRFGQDYPFSPPFVRVIRPKFLPFMHGGGGHVTIGGAICMEILTSTGWTVSTSLESVLISVKMAMSSLDPQPARLLNSSHVMGDYSAYEALEAFQRFAHKHNWKVPSDVMANATRT